MTLIRLRPYQDAAVAAVEDRWAKNITRPALVMATGTGKTATAAHLIARHGPGTLFLVHRDELASQAERAFHDVGLETGVVKAERDDVDAPVVIGSVQTLARSNRLARLAGARDTSLIVVDEAHRAAAASYRGILTGLGAFDSEAPIRALGLSATLSRSDGASLGAVWQEAAFTYDILDGISDGYLCDVTGRLVTVDGLSLAQVKMSHGDFTDASLSQVLASDDVRRAVVEAYTEHAADMPGIVFTPDVASARKYTESFTEAGFTAATIWGAMPRAERHAALAAAARGDVQILVNCAVLTEGFDLPRLQCAVIARPTTHAGTYVQMVGRITRPYPGKDRGLVLDVVGATLDHRLATIADLSSRRIREVREGESLREAAEREIKEKNPNLAGYVVTTEEVELFRRSRSVWLQTYGGVWFIPCGNAIVFLWPGRDDRYDVAIRPLDEPGGRWIQRDVSLDPAMAWGEEYAERYAEAWQAQRGRSYQIDRGARWRKGDPSEDQLIYAKSLGLDVPEGARAGEVSGIIDVYRASEVLDRKRTR